jgi:hypothetical protein
MHTKPPTMTRSERTESAFPEHCMPGMPSGSVVVAIRQVHRLIKRYA